jgi:DNA (cytosine-5)-methyltransferase 1
MSTPKRSSSAGRKLTVAGLFAGVGGLVSGLERAGHQLVLLCEIDPYARRVLHTHFGGVPLDRDVCDLDVLPEVDLVAAGFPCQDLSQAGRTAGIRGARSSVIGKVFGLVPDHGYRRPQWILLENVPFMLSLDGGSAMRYITETLVGKGYRWAYRTVDSRAFGLPQRRRRVIFLASQSDDPRRVLFGDETPPPLDDPVLSSAYGFYWTEGNRGLGWAVDSVPPLKGGSGFGIPSPPAIWDRSGRSIVTPDIRGVERLQGFEAGWTEPAQEEPGARPGTRWRLVGNAVSVPVAKWVGERLLCPLPHARWEGDRVCQGNGWPAAAYGIDGKVYRIQASPWPVRLDRPHLLDFLGSPTQDLSARATSGFLRRARASRLHFIDGFLDDVEFHLRRMDPSGRFRGGESRSEAIRGMG